MALFRARRAGRGENGFTATLDIRNRQGTGSSGISPPVSEPKQGPKLVQTAEAHTMEAKAETSIEAPKEDKTGISTPAEKSKQTASKGKGKGIFAQASKPKTTTPVKTTEEKQAENEAPTPAETGNQAEETIPDQETPAEEAAQEQTQTAKEATQAVRDPFAGDEPGQEDGQDGDLTSGETDDLVKAVADTEAKQLAEGEAQAEKPKSIFSFGPKSKASAG